MPQIRNAPPNARAKPATAQSVSPASSQGSADISAKVDTLNEESQKMGAALYAASAEQGETGDVPGGEPGTADGGSATGGSDDDVVDAEVVDDEPTEENK